MIETNNVVDRLPSKDLFYHGTIPEPLSEEGRQWLAQQLHEWPKRINEARTCAIGALTDMAVTEFCRIMFERQFLSDRIDVLAGLLREARQHVRTVDGIVEVKIDVTLASLTQGGKRE
jgi:hypothetical protein